ncbi:MAG: choice-of-anchor Q domain-containing protein [Planctomycetota bacterium]
MACAVLAPPARASTVVVSGFTGADIQAAVTAAGPGGVVLCPPGTYTFNTTVDTFPGGFPRETTIRPQVSGTRVTFEGPARMLDVRTTTLIVEDVDFVNASAPGRGGAIRVFEQSTFNVELIARRCGFYNCSASIDGGAIYAEGQPSSARLLWLTDCVFDGNQAVVAGGGVGTLNCDSRLNRCTFVNNEAGARGGAVHGEYRDGTTMYMNIANSLIAQNSAQVAGGVSGVQLGFDLIIRNCTIADNVASAGLVGGGLFLDDGGDTGRAALFLYNSIVWNNTNIFGDTNQEVQVGRGDQGSLPDEFDWRFNIIQGDLSDDPWNGDGNIPFNPLFRNPANLDYRLSLGSPAGEYGVWIFLVNSGQPGSFDASGLDLLGDPRIVDDPCRPLGLDLDLGAYESQLFASAVCYVDASRPTGGVGNAWDEAFSDLQNAIAFVRATRNCLNIQAILIAEGTYTPTQPNGARSASFELADGVNLFGGYPTGGGTPDPAAHPTILSGDFKNDDAPDGSSGTDNNSYHVVTGDGVTDVSISDLTITRGAATGAVEHSGGGLYLFNVERAVMRGVTFNDNQASNSGGGAYLDQSREIDFDDCVFDGNSAIDPVNARSGAIEYSGTKDSLVRNSSILNNTSASNVGAIRLTGFSTDVELESLMVSGNSAAGENGAISVSDGSTATISDSVFTDNEAGAGAAISVFDAEAVVVNTLVYANRVAGGFGSGALRASTNGRLHIVNSTVAFNTGNNETGGVRSGASNAAINIENSILFGNTGATAASIEDAQVSGLGSSIDVDASLIEGLSLFAGGLNIDADPLFADAASGDFAVSVGSPVIDAGDSSRVPPGVTTDLAGGARVVNSVSYADTGVPDGVGGVVDMGAYEAPSGFANVMCAFADITSFGVCVPGSGDAAVDLSDFACFLSEWSVASAFADITTAGACTPGAGGDGVDLSDFSCYLAEWSVGCP